VLNLPEAKIAQLIEEYGDIVEPKYGVENPDVLQGLLEGQQTPTVYDVRRLP
jgi:hypothetical protein